MKSIRPVTALAGLLLVPALVFAQSAAPVAASSPTRDQVRKEAREALKAGTIEHGELDCAASRPPPKPQKSATSRDQVRQETLRAAKAGQLPHGDADPCAEGPQPKPAKSTVSREQVRKEGADAAKAGQTESGEASVLQKAEEGVKPKK